MARFKGTWFRRVLRTVGLESRAHSAELTARVARAEERVTLTRQLLAHARARMLHWKGKYAVRKEPGRTRELELEVARLTAALREKLTRIEKIEALVAATEELARSGREQLNTIEVKLDLVDGALNTLDRRYRTIVTRGTGAGA